MELDWNEVVADVGPRLYRYFQARFSAEESSDLTQETLIRLVRKVQQESFLPERGSLRMYAFGIAHFVSLESFKTANSLSLISETCDQITAVMQPPLDEAMAEQTELTRAKRALKRLPEPQAEILSLMIDEEMTLNDIAILLGMPVGTVKSHVFRAKERLREMLSDERKSL
jgi:RNA polymerase sigma-70 factor (ECF subfamily)